MATVYSSERAKYGNLTGQIIIWPVQINPDINAQSNIRDLPSGYLRCDGTIYNVVDYPQLAAICGVGETGKFVRRSIDGTALQSLTDAQFVVPDLGSKYPKPTPGADSGSYKNVRKNNSLGVEVNRSGVGIEATSTLGTTIDVTYTGTFTVPSQSIPLRGRPSWTYGTTGGRRTEEEIVDASAMAGHMHFGSTKRTRLKAQNEVDPSSPSTIKPPQAIGMVAHWNASTVPIDDWNDATVESGNSFTANNQPPCRAFVSNRYAVHYEFYIGTFPGNVNPVTYSDGCFNSAGDVPNLENDWKYQCLMTDDWNNYPISASNHLMSGLTPHSSNAWKFPWPIGCQVFAQNQPIGGITYSVGKNFTAGASGVAVDWKNASLHDVLPINSNLEIDTSRLYPSLFNTVEESADFAYTTDPSKHYHRVNLAKGTHSFALVTSPLELSPDALKTTLNLSVDNAYSIDTTLSPFIVLEYLIKI